MEDAWIINSYLDKKEIECLLIPKDALSMAVLECYLDFNYFVCCEDIFEEFLSKEESFSNVPLLKITDYCQKEELPEIQFFISQREIKISGYQYVDLNLNCHYLYEKGVLLRNKEEN